MAVALIVHKKNHSPDDLRNLADAPFFGAHRIRKEAIETTEEKRPYGRKVVKPYPKLEELTDEDLIEPGIPIMSHGIAPSTREAFEKAVGTALPVIDDPTSGTKYMKSKNLKELLKSTQPKKLEGSAKDLYEVLSIVGKLGFTVGWFEDLEEKRPNGWR